MKKRQKLNFEKVAKIGAKKFKKKKILSWKFWSLKSSLGQIWQKNIYIFLSLNWGKNNKCLMSKFGQKCAKKKLKLDF